MLVVVVGHLVLVGGLVGLVLVLLAGLEVVEQGLEAVTKEEAGNQGSVCLGQELSLTLLFDCMVEEQKIHILGGDKNNVYMDWMRGFKPE